MGVESGMPAYADLLPILLKLKLKIKDAPWQATVIGRGEIWPVHLRTGLEDTVGSDQGGSDWAVD
nr:hypothetical protein [Acidovorax sp. SRB_24]